MDFEELKECFKRCKSIIIWANDFEKGIQEVVNEEYTLEKCYQDILRCSQFSWAKIKEYIIKILSSDDIEKRKILLDNMHLLNLIEFKEIISLNNDTIQNVLVQNFENFSQEQINLLFAQIIYDCNKDMLLSSISNGIISRISAKNKENLICYIAKYNRNILLDRYKEFFEGECNFEIYRLLNRFGVTSSYALEHKENILKGTYGNSIIDYAKWLRENNETISLEQFVSKLYYNIDDIQSLKMLEQLFKELLEYQNLDITDMEKAGAGAYSTAYKIGEFVIKTGGPRGFSNIPYNRRILTPLIRIETEVENEQSICVEVQNLVDANWYDGMNKDEIEEELYKIYKELRDSGIVWSDVKKENVGRLIRPNSTNYMIDTLVGEIKGIGTIKDKEKLRIIKTELEINSFSTGMTGIKKDDKVLETGELVIIDTDFLENENDCSDSLFLYRKFEKKYRKEKGMSITD